MEYEKVKLFCDECVEYTPHFISGSGNKSMCDLCDYDRTEVLSGLELKQIKAQIENKIYEEEVLKWN